MRRRFRIATLLITWPVLSAGTSALAQTETSVPTRPQIAEIVDQRNVVTLRGNTRPEATAANDRGRVADSLSIEHVQLQLRLPAEKEAQLEQLIEDQANPSSPSYHKWLTAEQFRQQFSVAPEDIDAITRWLESQGFTVNVVYPRSIDFSGTAGEVRSAFRTEIHNLEVGGAQRFANMTDPQIPAALAPAVAGVASFNNFQPHPTSHPRTDYTVAGGYYLMVPGDLATIYNFNPLFSGSVSGQNQTIVVIEDTDVYSTNDWSTFRSTLGLSGYTGGSFTQLHPAPPMGVNNCSDPSVNGDDAEAILDAEWASAAAPSAAIVLASCEDTAQFGGFIALQNMLNESGSPPAVVSISYGESESLLGSSENAFINSLYQQGVAEGVSIFVSSGDEGAASSDAGAAYSTQGIAVSGFTSTPYNVSVGGTDFGDTATGSNNIYWNSANSSNYASAKSYVPEIPWNDSCASGLISSYLGYSSAYGSSGFCNSSTGDSSFLNVVSGSGGPSGCGTGSPSIPGVVGGTCAGYPKPSWQSVLGNPNDGVRDIPDVSLFAANGVWGHYYVVCYSDPSGGGKSCSGAPSTWAGYGGTSVSSPIMAGAQALVNQVMGQRAGNPAPTYYSLASAEYGTTGNSSCNSSLGYNVSNLCVFNDVTQGDMDVVCKGTNNCYTPSGAYGVLSQSNSAFQPAYGAASGWDFATGIGTANVGRLVHQWPTPTTAPAITSASSTSFAVGSAGTFTVTATGYPAPAISESGTLPGGVTFNSSTNALAGTPAAGSAGTYNITFTASNGIGANAVQNFALTVTGSGGVGFFPNGYEYERQVTINYAPASDQTDFPVLISGTYSYLATVANGGNVSNPNGYDILFTSDAAGTQVLPFERASYNATTGAVDFWVQVPTLSHSGSNVIYLFYGNPSVAGDPSNTHGAWDSSFVMVSHMAAGSGTVAADSTSNGNNGTLSGSPLPSWSTTGKPDGGLSFGGSNSYVNVANPGDFNFGSNFTITAWVNSNAANVEGNILTKTASNSWSAGAKQFIVSGNELKLDAWGVGTVGTSAAINSSTWYQVAVSYQASNNAVELYVNGALSASGTLGLGSDPNGEAVLLGAQTPTGDFWNGLLDEVKVSSSVRSAAWIAAEYANQSSPGTFYTIGSATTGGGGPPTPAISSLSIPSGAIGAAVTITGSNFGTTQGGSTVTFNGTAATPTNWGANSIAVTVPAGATTGNVVVTVSSTASNGVGFTVVPAPAIGSLSILTGAVGAAVTITGSNFGTSQGNGTVTFNGTVAAVTNWAAGSIAVTVPAGATTGNVVVFASGVNSNGVNFTVTGSTGWSNGYTYQRQITVNYVPASDQTDFPVLISGTYSYLATVANGGNVSNPNGYDILFTSDAAGTQVLPFERASYNATTGAVDFWVQVPTLSHSGSNVIYLFYGNPSVAGDPSNTHGAWDSSFVMVSHMAAGSGTVAADSTSNGNNGTLSGSPLPSWSTTGKPDGGLSFGGSNSYVNVANPGDFNFGSNFTITAWVNSNAANVEGNILTKTASNSWSAGAKQFIVSGNELKLDAWGVGTVGTSAAINSSTWYQVAVSYQASNNAVELYVNGALSASGTLGLGSDPNGEAVLLGAQTPTGDFWNGLLDEVKVSSSVRSAAWIAAEYANQSSPGTFYTIGSATTGGGGPPTPAISSLSIPSGAIGAAVTITGSNFGTTQGGSTVTFNGTAATPTNWGANSIAVTVPAGATTGNVVVTVSSTASNGVGFTVVPAPAIGSLSILTGAVGAAVTITGSNFGTSQGNGTVTFNGTVAAVTNWAAGSIAVTVPAGATTGNVVVFASGVNSNGVNFTVTGSTGWSNGYTYQRQITVNYVPASDQTDFPVLISGTYSYLATVANGGNVSNPNGYDILFTSDAAGTQVLPFERASYNATTGAVDFWVQVPTLSHSGSNVIYLFYGNPSVAGDPSNTHGAWDSSFVMVSHMAAGSGTVAADSTSNGNNGTLSGSPLPSWSTTGKPDGGLSFGGSNSYVNVANPGDFNFGSNFTITAWVNSNAANVEGNILTKTASNSWSAGAKQFIVSGNELKLDAWGVGTVGTSAAINSSTWYQVAVSYQASNNAVELYVNGALSASGTLGLGSDPNGEAVLLGAQTTTGDFWNGLLDEVKVSSSVRSAAWIAAEYANQSSPGTFYTIGSAATDEPANGPVSFNSSDPGSVASSGPR